MIISKVILFLFFGMTVLAIDKGLLDSEITLEWAYTNPNSWYGTSDLCVINDWEGNLGLSDFSSKNCHGPSKWNEEEGIISVGYGSSYNASCKPPLSDRPQFSQALKGFDDPKSFKLLDAMQDIHDTERTLVFFGDSMSRQVGCMNVRNLASD